MSDLTKNIVMAVLFVFFLALIFIGQKTISRMNLVIMLVGLAGLLGLLYVITGNINKE